MTFPQPRQLECIENEPGQFDETRAMIEGNPATHAIVYPRTVLRRRSTVHRDITRLFSEIRGRSELGLHLGAAGTRIPGLINCDLFDPGADRKVDATDLSSFANSLGRLD